MSGFAVMIDTSEQERGGAEFSQFVQLVAGYKLLDQPATRCSGQHCLAAKLDSPSSLHRGVTVDEETGSWLLAAGTVIDSHDVAPDGNLGQLLRDYLVHGESVLARCDGLFALVIYNGLTQSVAIISDPFGYFSIFYGNRNGQVFVATSSLAVAQQIQAEPSELGVNCFLRTGKVFGDMTLWQEVKRMRAATVLEFTPGATRKSVYWQPTVDESLAKLSLADSVELSMQVLQCILKRNLEREGKVWTDLTGGFDTRFLVMFLARIGLPFKANFVGAPDHPDVRIARTIVNKMGWEYQHFDLPKTWPQEGPHYLREALGRGDGHLNILLLLRALWAHRQEAMQYPTLLSGLGGEMWRGPSWWPEKAALGQSSVVHYERQLWSLMHPIPDSIFVADSVEPVKAELIEQFKKVGERCPDAPNTLKLSFFWAYRETAHVGAWASVGAGLVRIIPPLFSKDIFTHVNSLNYRWRVKNHLFRHMFERYSPVLAEIEVEGRGPAVPKRLTNFYRFIPSRLGYYRKVANKVGQITFGKSLWPTKSARDYASYSLVEARRELLKFAEAERLFEPAEMHSGKLYNFGQLSTFLTQAETESFPHEEFLGRMLTLEMALRAAGTALK
jgi:hypothetical protein